MNKRFLLIIGILLICVNLSYADEYIVKQLTEILRKPSGEQFGVYDPKINDGGKIVWYGGYEITPDDLEIYMYTGSDVIQITNNSFDDLEPVINELGQIAWHGTSMQLGEHVFMYDGNTITQIPGNAYNAHVGDISNTGQVVWDAILWGYSSEIYYSDGTSTVRFPGNVQNDSSPRIYNSGQIVWGCQDPVSRNMQVCISDGVTINRVSNVLWNAAPVHTKEKYIVWSAINNNTGEIFLFDGLKTIQITSNDAHDKNPRCNAKGQITWESGDNFQQEIMFFNGNSIIQVTNDTRQDVKPDINDDGVIVWAGGYLGASCEIFAYNGSAITQITDNGENDIYPRINNNGLIVWTGGNTGTSAIFLATPTNYKPNNEPTSDAGINLTINSSQVSATALHGMATDPDTGDLLTYKWLEGSTVLLDSTPVGSNGDCPLSLAGLGLSIGTHDLILEVSDGTTTASDDMILTIGNSEPNAAPSGEGIYDIGSIVNLSGEVSDFDGDSLTYTWLEGSTVLGDKEITKLPF